MTFWCAYFFVKAHLHFFQKKSPKEVLKQYESRFFLLFLLDDRRIWIRIRNPIQIHIFDYSFRILEAQKHMDPVDPDPDPITVINLSFS